MGLSTAFLLNPDCYMFEEVPDLEFFLAPHGDGEIPFDILDDGGVEPKSSTPNAAESETPAAAEEEAKEEEEEEGAEGEPGVGDKASSQGAGDAGKEDITKRQDDGEEARKLASTEMPPEEYEPKFDTGKSMAGKKRRRSRSL